MTALVNLIDPSDPRPRYMQLYLSLRHQIAEGTLATGYRLPASRALAKDLGLARSTVVTAYDQLVAEGYIEARQGAGMFVCDVSPMLRHEASKVAARPVPPRTSLVLAPGLPDPDVFPLRSWARALARVARNTPEALVEQGDRFGNWALRQQIARYAETWRGVRASADQVLMTSGATEALELALDLLVQEGSVALEDPGYQPAWRYCQRRGWDCLELPVERKGVSAPKHMAEVTILTPSHQFPLGGALPLASRQKFLAAAIARNGWIIEDDFDSEFRYSGQPIPAMAALNHQGRCIYVGTFSKTFSHAVRLGYLILPEGLVDRFRDGLAHRGGGAALTAQQALADFMEEGLYDMHIRRARRTYAERYAAITDCLARWPDHLGYFERHAAGMKIAFHLSPEFKDRKVAEAARQQGFGVRPLSDYSTSQPTNGLLIGFCQSPPDMLPSQTAQLREIILSRAG